MELIEKAKESVLTLEGVSPETQREVVHILNYAQERAQVEQEVLISELSMFRVLSSLGATIAIFNHQLRAIVDGIRAVHTDLRELRTHILPEGTPSYQKILDQIRNWRNLLEAQVDETNIGRV